MATSIKNGLRIGLIFGVIFIFLILIGFIHVGTTIIGNFLGNLDGLNDDAQLPEVNLLIFIALIGSLAGTAAQKKVLNSNGLSVLLSGLTTGLCAGLMVGAVIYSIGKVHIEGVDFRTYFPQLGPNQARYLLFYRSPFTAALRYLAYFILSGLAGALLMRSLSGLGLWKSLLNNSRTKMVGCVECPKIRQMLENKIVVLGLMVILALVLYFLPILWSSYWNYIMGTVAIYILLGLGLNIIVGYSGQLVLGYVAFFATGSYTFALLTAPEPHAIGLNLWLAVGISIVVSTMTGLLLGLPILSLRGDYLAIVTLGFGEIVRILIRSDFLTPLTNGPRGITNIAQPLWRGRVFSDVNYMHLLMLLVLVGVFVSKRLKDSRTGRAWIAIREDQTVAQGTGVNPYRYKILALLLGAAFAGLSGALFASRNQFTGPEDFTLMVSVNVLCIVIVGGMGSLPGVIVGAFILKGLPELLRELADYRLLAFGALLVLMMIVRPEGILPVKRFRSVSWQKDRLKDDPAEVEV